MNLQNITNITTSINENDWVAISTISTVVLALVAIYSLYFNLRLWYSQDKPWLNFKLNFEYPTPNESSFFTLIVENVGKGPALDIKFEIDNIDEFFKFDSLAPKSEIHVYKIKDSFTDKELKIKNIVYKDINQIKRSQKQQVIAFNFSKLSSNYS